MDQFFSLKLLLCFKIIFFFYNSALYFDLWTPFNAHISHINIYIHIDICLGYLSVWGIQLISFLDVTNVSHTQGSGCMLATFGKRKYIYNYHLTPQLALNNTCVWFNDNLIHRGVFYVTQNKGVDSGFRDVYKSYRMDHLLVQVVYPTVRLLQYPVRLAN